MNSFAAKIFLCLALVLIPVSLDAEGIQAISDNSYETEEMKDVIPAEEYLQSTELVFKSSTALRGRVEIFSTDAENIEIIYHKVLYAESREQAESFAAQISVSHAPWRKTANLSGQIECEIYLPQKFSINLDSVVGYYLSIRGPFPEAYVGGDYYEEIRVTRIELGLTIKATNSPIIIRDIKGPMLIEGKGGGITARNIDSGTGIGIATFQNERGAISIDGFTGDELRCISQDGKITLEKISLLNGARAYVSNSGINSDIYIEIEDIKDSRLEVINKEADVSLLLPRDIRAEFDITSDPDEGEIEVSGLPLITDKIDWGILVAHTFRYDSKIIVDVRGTGKVTIRRKGF
jgi:hypothetical protein